MTDLAVVKPDVSRLNKSLGPASSARRATFATPGRATFADTLKLAARQAGRPGLTPRVGALPLRIRGFDQTSPEEYNSPSQAGTWGYSTCSAASLTAVLRGVGLPVRIADVLAAMPEGLTPELGLVSRPALVQAASRFGLKASDDVQSYDQLAAATANGQPVLVDLTSERFPEGHWLVVTGVGPDGVSVADSSRYDLSSLSRDEFLASWSGRGIRVKLPTPPRSISTLGERTA